MIDQLFAAPTYAEVAVNEPVFQLFTYVLAEELGQCGVGTIVEVPFGRKTSRGCVVRIFTDLPDDLTKMKIRAVIRQVTPGFVVQQQILELALWMSRYYLSPPGDACACVSFIGFNDIASQTVKRYLLTDEGHRVLHMERPVKLGAKQAAALEYLAQNTSTLSTLSEISSGSGAALSTINSLVKHGWIEEFVQEAERSDDYEHGRASEGDLPLSEEQETVFGSISDAMDRSHPTTFLLHGVTGSGKTEIYLQAIRKALLMGGQAIVLVPEISLTPQTVNRFRSRFGDVVGVYHSRLTVGQKFDLWKSVSGGRVKIMVGARSALFTPFENLRVVVVDEEHEMTYKQDSSPRYHARDMAIKMATDCKAVCILGSATPSIESYYKAKAGKFHLLNLHQRIDGRPLPPVTVVDLAEEVREEGNPEFLSKELLTAMQSALAAHEQVLLFLNRRGFFNFVVCLSCKEAIKCKHCDVALTHHRITNILMCHYCGREYVIPRKCCACESEELNMIGLGTERLEDIVAQHFQSARIMRLDLDTTRKRNSFLEAWKVLESGEVDIILGTQMIAKGLHLENVTVVGLPLTDGAFYQPDFRAAERAFALMTQVAGRAGRGKKSGRVFLQTYVPDHYAVKFAQSHDYIGFYNKEIRVREVLRFPPHYRLIALLATGKKEDETAELVKTFAALLKKHAHRYDGKVTVLGPAPAPLRKINDSFRWRILLRSTDQASMRQIIANSTADFQDVKGKSQIQLLVDIDPVDLL